MIFISVRRDELSRLHFLSKVPGFSNDSHPNDLPDNQNYVTYIAIFDKHFGLRDKIQLKRSIKKNGGRVVNELRGGIGPILSKESRDMLVDSFIMAGAAFSSGLVGVHFLHLEKS
jgi:hypothetical protein